MLSARTSRRRFLGQAVAATVFSSTTLGKSASAFAPAALDGAGHSNASIFPSRAPLAPNQFDLLPLGSVLPSGWLRRQLEIQADGLGGHLDEVWKDVGSSSGWLGGPGESWERGPYFLDGLIPLAYQLDNARLKAKAQTFIEWTLASQSADGMFGPKTNNDWWPRMVMIKALTQYQEVTGDARVIPLLTRYFEYQLKALPARPLKDWGKFRWQDNALCVLWLYNRTGGPGLLDLVRLLHQQGHDWQAQFADFRFTEPTDKAMLKPHGLNELALSAHGVNVGQSLKAAPVWSVVTGRREDRDGIQQALAALDKYHGLPNGMFSCDEHLAGRNPSQGSELCTVVETMYSLEQSLAILGDATLGDRLERIAFNALPGTFTDDMWAHQYDQEPNQVESSLHTKPWTTNGPEANLFGLEPNFGCCTANFHQGWPKLSSSLWMGSQDGGLVACVYSPCQVKTSVAGVAVRLSEVTDYPFGESIHITVSVARPVAFPLTLRIPQWADEASLHINGKIQPIQKTGGFARVARTWNSGDVVLLRLPMKPRIVRGYRDSISVEVGPIVLSYPIGEEWVKLRDRAPAADWQAFPKSPWNYALAIDEESLRSLPVTWGKVTSVPFGRKYTPIQLKVKAHKLPQWRAIDGAAEPPPQSPVVSNEPEEQITLVPYAAAKLRITAFPQILPTAT